MRLLTFAQIAFIPSFSSETFLDLPICFGNNAFVPRINSVLTFVKPADLLVLIADK